MSGCGFLFNCCQFLFLFIYLFVFEQISLSQSIKIFLSFPVTKLLRILIFSAGLFHLTSKNAAVQGTGMA